MTMFKQCLFIVLILTFVPCFNLEAQNNSDLDAETQQWIRQMEKKSTIPGKEGLQWKKWTEKFKGDLTEMIKRQKLSSGSVVVGHLEVPKGINPLSVSSSALIMENGFFMNRIVENEGVLSFVLHGHETINFELKNHGDIVKNLGSHKLNPISTKNTVSVLGEVSSPLPGSIIVA